MAFESMPLLYNADFPAENPLSDGGAWGTLWTRPPLMGEGGGVHGTVEFVVNGSLYIRDVYYGSTVEAVGCPADSGLGAANESYRIAFWLDPSNLIGYSWGYGGGIGQSFFMRRYDGGSSFTTIGSANTRNDHPTQMGIRITPTDVEGWGLYAGVWEKVSFAADTTYRGPFYASLETEEQGGTVEVAWGCFGAHVVNRQYIYRWLKGGIN